jgi:hypothetical protein
MRRRTAVGAVLLLTGVCLGVTGLSAQTVAPAPAVHVADVSGAPVERPVSAAAPLDPSPPVAIDIAAIDVHSAVGSVGLAPNGAIEVPAPGPAYGVPAWYRFSPTPGARGPAVVVGHLDTAHGGPSVFFRLAELTPGQQVEVRRADGSVAVFEVTAVASYAKHVFPTAAVFGDLDHAGLRLITCGGPIDPATGHYRDNTVVFATLVAARHPEQPTT